MTSPALSLKGISRRFGAVLANDDASLEVAPGTIHALVGENGAGKSTLMKIAYGQVRADAGTIAIRGTQVPRASASAGERSFTVSPWRRIVPSSGW